MPTTPLWGASYCHLQVVGSGPPHCPPSLFLFSDVINRRYLINCGEGTQRVMNQHRMKISRLENVFITSLSWKNIGGLVGLTLTLRDTCHSKKVNYYGPPGLSEVLSAARVFAVLDGIDTVCKTYDELPITNETCTIQAVPIYEKIQDFSAVGFISLGKDAEIVKGTPLGSILQSMDVEEKDDSDDELSSPEAKRMKLSTAFGGDMTVAYIFKLKDKPGNVVTQKAVALGLPPGPSYRELKLGNTVTTAEGKTIHPEDVLSPTERGQHCIILECPSEDYLDSLESNAVFCDYQKSDTEMPAVLVVHQTPPHVVKTDRYQAWMERFGTSTDHLVMNEDCNSDCLAKSYIMQTKLNMIHSEIFPNVHMNFPVDQEKTHQDGRTTQAECLLKYHMRPLTRWDRSAIPVLPRSQIEAEANEVDGFVEHLQEFQKSLESSQRDMKTTIEQEDLKNKSPEDEKRTETESCDSNNSESESTSEPQMSSQNAPLQMATPVELDRKGSFPELVFLGTGSAMPNNSRNVSSILLNCSEDISMIMDCGEGTLGQLYRHYGDATADILHKLQCIYVSHLHADHHTGLINLLLERQRLSVRDGKDPKTMNLVLPNRLIGWLKLFDSKFEPILENTRITPCKELLRNTHGNKPDLVQLHDQLNLQRIQTVAVNHFAQPYGVALTSKDGWKIVYSGDTMPSHGLIDIGKNADLLIHEGTLQDGMEDEALDKRHSTISQAVAIGNRMNAGFLLLTHFSQRYHYIPVINVGESDLKKLGIAYDYMKVTFEDLKVLPKLLPVLKCLFSESLVETENLALKRSLRHQKIVSQS
ncbi:zinc phosphodiesterase ELAC protein 2-like [Glandiceps talaboti]